MINKLFVGDSNTDYALFMDDDMVDEVYLGDTKIYSKPANIYGWHVDPTISDPSDAITYIRDARGKNTAKMISTNTGYQFDYGDWEDAFFMPKPCMLKSNGIVDYYLDPNDYNKKLEDGTISDVANANYDGNAMMEWPLIYYKFEGLEDKGYKAVEYIKSTGTQCIDTDIIPTNQTKIVMDIQFGNSLTPTTNASGVLICSRTLSDGALTTAYMIEVVKGNPTTKSDILFYAGYRWTESEQSKYRLNNQTITSRNLLTIHRGGSSWGSNSCPTDATIMFDNPTTPLRILGMQDVGVIFNIYEIYMYSIKIYLDGNNLSHNLIPVERISDNELGLYDTLTDKFYTNSGTGTFVKGSYITTGDGWFYCADRKINNSYKCWSNYNANDEIGQHFYTAIYNSTGTSKFKSLSGVQLTQANGSADVSGSDELTRALANNTINGVEWYTEVWSDRILIDALLILIGKSLNTQAIFGNGLVTGLQTSKSNYITGTLNNKGLFWGNTSALTDGVKVFGMENYWGCVWRRVAGLIGTSTGFAYKLTYGNIDGSTTIGYNSTASGYLTINKKPSSGDIVKTMSFGKYGFLPYTVGGTSSSYWTDWYANGNNGYIMVGGASYGESYVGAFYLALGYSFTVVNDLISSALSCKPYFIGLPKITTPNVRISKEKVVDIITSNSATVEAQLYVQDVIDLPEYNTLANRTLLAGSTAIVISTHEIYMLDNNNEWILQGSAI